jgi:hypothetical protein
MRICNKKNVITKYFVIYILGSIVNFDRHCSTRPLIYLFIYYLLFFERLFISLLLDGDGLEKSENNDHGV